MVPSPLPKHDASYRIQTLVVVGGERVQRGGKEEPGGAGAVRREAEEDWGRGRWRWWKEPRLAAGAQAGGKGPAQKTRE
jgi:hypothetical protein